MYRNDDSSSSGDEIIEEYKRLLATKVNKKEKNQEEACTPSTSRIQIVLKKSVLESPERVETHSQEMQAEQIANMEAAINAALERQ